MSVDSFPPLRTKKVVVPSAVFLQVIGKGSCNITAIKMATNTQIEVDKHNKHGSSRVLTIRLAGYTVRLCVYVCFGGEGGGAVNGMELDMV